MAHLSTRWILRDSSKRSSPPWPTHGKMQLFDPSGQKHSPLGANKGKGSAWNILFVQVKKKKKKVPCSSWEIHPYFFSCIPYSFIIAFKSAPLEQGGAQVWKPRVIWKHLSLWAKKLLLFDRARRMGKALKGPWKGAGCEVPCEPEFTQSRPCLSGCPQQHKGPCPCPCAASCPKPGTGLH